MQLVHIEENTYNLKKFAKSRQNFIECVIFLGYHQQEAIVFIKLHISTSSMCNNLLQINLINILSIHSIGRNLVYRCIFAISKLEKIPYRKLSGVTYWTL